MAYNKSQIINSVGPTVGSAHKITQVFHDATFRGTDFQIFEGRLYVGSYTEGFRIYDVSDITNPVLLGKYPLTPRASWQADCNVARFGDKIILSFGLDDEDPEGAHTEFVDVTDPANPKLILNVPGGSHTTDINSERNLYFPMGGFNRIVLLVGDYPFNQQHRYEPHRPFEIYDISPVLENPPRNPEFLYGKTPNHMWKNSKYCKNPELVPDTFSYLHECELYTNFKNSGKDILVLCESSALDNGAVFIIDVTNPKEPVVLNRIVDPRGQTMMYREALFMKGNEKYLFVDDEPFYPEGYKQHSVVLNDDGGLMLFEVPGNLTTATLVSEYHLKRVGNEAGYVFTHMWDSSNHMCVVSCFGGGTRLVSYKDPANPVEIAHYVPIGAQAWRAAFYDGHIVVSDSFRGLEILKYNPYDTTTSTASIVGGLSVAPSTRMGTRISTNERFKVGQIMFGGRNDSQYLADTWNWDGNSWTLISADSAANIPGRRMFHLQESVVGMPIIFGGHNGTEDLGDFHVYTGTSWMTLASPAFDPRPSARHAAAGAAFDEDLLKGFVYMFGGRKHANGKTLPSSLAGFLSDSDFFASAGDTVHGDMWRCRVTEGVPTPTSVFWEQLTPVNPPPARFGAAMVYNYATKKVLMFGGVDASGNVLNDTWEYNIATNTWTQVNTGSKTPPARAFHCMGAHEISGQVVLHGGYDASKNLLQDTWVWNENKRGWCNKTGSGQGLKPSAPFPTMRYDIYTGEVIMLGQSDSLKLYAWNGSEWRVAESTF